MTEAEKEEHEPPRPVPNWLTCASCQAPLVTAPELVEEELPVLRGAVYAYKLDMLDKEVTVYSATNTADHRFDVVRAILCDETAVPSVSQQNLLEERESLQLFLRHFQLAQARGHELIQLTPTRTRELLEDLDRLAEENPDDTNSSPEDIEPGQHAAPAESNSSASIGDDTQELEPPKRRVSELVADRIHTSYSESTDAYSWFPGYSWTIASCKVCREHLGWVFWKQQEEVWERCFVSLIVTRLREKFIPTT